jgi:hypothetical protein
MTIVSCETALVSQQHLRKHTGDGFHITENDIRYTGDKNQFL